MSRDIKSKLRRKRCVVLGAVANAPRTHTSFVPDLSQALVINSDTRTDLVQLSTQQ